MEHAELAAPGGIQFTIFGESRTLRPNMRTFLRFQQKTGKNPFDHFLWDPTPPEFVVALVWAAIGGDESGYTFEQVADELEFDTLKAVNDFILRFFLKGKVPEPPKNASAAE
jgi:hypothetical protein